MKNVRLIVDTLRVEYRRFGLAGLVEAERVLAVDGASFTVREGEIYCLVGESGCGKTSLGKAVAGILPRYAEVSGRILFKPSDTVANAIKALGVRAENGLIDLIDAYQSPQVSRLVRRDVQMIFQDPYAAVDPRMKVRHILLEPALAIGMDLEAAKKKAAGILEEMGLSPLRVLEMYPSQLSGGELQRITIARALMTDPVLLVEDEPVTMLDASVKAEVIDVLLKLREEKRISQLFITHDLALARHVCDRIAVMYLGKIVEEADAEKLVRRPLHPYTRALLAAVLDPDPRNRKARRYIPIKGTIEEARRPEKGCVFRPRCVAYDQTPAVRPKCESEQPPLAEAEPGHRVACWIHVTRAPSGEENPHRR